MILLHLEVMVERTYACGFFVIVILGLSWKPDFGNRHRDTDINGGEKNDTNAKTQDAFICTQLLTN